ncbi:MAG TPA: hypothetical protein PLD70_11545, partial [Thermotogota bacterium]|nr:hypothetical protein [Thermotogota bacterium]
MFRALFLILCFPVLFANCSTPTLPLLEGPWLIHALFPANHATQIATNTALSWEILPSRVPLEMQSRSFYYTVFLDDHLPLETVVEQGYQATLWQPDTPLRPNTAYYWKIQLYDEEELLATGPVWDFSTLSALPESSVVVSSVEALRNAIDHARVGGPKRI